MAERILAFLDSTGSGFGKVTFFDHSAEHVVGIVCSGGSLLTGNKEAIRSAILQKFVEGR